MKRTLVTVALTIAMAFFALGQEKDRQMKDNRSKYKGSSIEQTLVDLEHEWNQALVRRDKAWMERHYADEYSFTDSHGKVFNKAQDMEENLKPDTNFESVTLSDVKVRVYGNTAVVTGLNTFRATDRKGDFGGQYRFTDIFVKRGGRWQVVTSQSTRVSER